MATVNETLDLPGGSSPDGVTVSVVLAGAGGAALPAGYGSIAGTTIVGSYSPTVTAGAWTLDLPRNDQITPTGTVWKIVLSGAGVSTEARYVDVDGPGPFDVADILTDAPATIDTSTYAALDARLDAIVVSGLTGDGTTDDTATIQAAIDAAGTAGGGIVRLPAGDFGITALTMDSARVHLVGTGRHATALKVLSGAADAVAVTGSYCSVRDLTINGNNLGSDALSLADGAVRFVGHNLYVMNAGAAGIHIEGAAAECHASQWTDINVIDCATYGVQIGAFGYDSQWSNLWVGGCNIGLSLTSGEHSFANLHLWGSTSHGASITSDRNRFVNGYIETNGGDGINLDTGAELNRFSNVASRANTGGGIVGGSGNIIDGVMAARMTGDKTRNNTSTFSDVTELAALPVEANTDYVLELDAFYMTSQTADLKLDFTLPAGATLLWGGNGLATGATSNFGVGDLNSTAAAESSFITLGGATTTYPQLASCRGLLRVGATAGTAQLQMGQVSADLSDTTLMEETTLRLIPVAT